MYNYYLFVKVGNLLEYWNLILSIHHPVSDI